MSNVFSSFQGTNTYSPLRAAFGSVYQKVSSDPKSVSGLALTEFVAGVLLSRPFRSSDFAQSLDKETSEICSSIIMLCMSEGLSEADRLSFASAFEPFFSVVESGTRH